MEWKKNRFHALIVGPNGQTNTRLYQAAQSYSCFESVKTQSKPERALFELENGMPARVIMVSLAYGVETVQRLVEIAKKTEQGSQAAYILVLGPEDRDRAMIAQFLKDGFDGFLFEPFSPDSLNEMTEIARKVVNQKAEAKERLAIELIVKKVIIQFGRFAHQQSVGRDTARSKAELMQTCALLKGFSPQALAVYQEFAVELFSEVPAPRIDNYGGVSSRVKRKVKIKQREQRESLLRSQMEVAA